MLGKHQIKRKALSRDKSLSRLTYSEYRQADQDISDEIREYHRYILTNPDDRIMNQSLKGTIAMLNLKRFQLDVDYPEYAGRESND